MHFDRMAYGERIKRLRTGRELTQEQLAEKINVTFKSITDYIILVAYLLKCFGVPKSDIKHFIAEFQDAIEALRKQIPINLFAKIVPTDTRTKLQSLQKFL